MRNKLVGIHIYIFVSAMIQMRDLSGQFVTVVSHRGSLRHSRKYDRA